MCGESGEIMAGGRKGKYEYWLTEDGLTLLSAWARDGLTMEQVAKNCGIVSSTLREWKNQFPAISAALKKGRNLADIEVENALYRRAVGYEYEEVKTKTDADGGVERTVTTKHVSPDVGAAAFWLKNRRPDLWRDRKDVKMDAEVKTENPFEGLTTEELKKLIKDG